jgi:hypothetical protein
VLFAEQEISNQVKNLVLLIVQSKEKDIVSNITTVIEASQNFKLSLIFKQISKNLLNVMIARTIPKQYIN